MGVPRSIGRTCVIVALACATSYAAPVGWSPEAQRHYTEGLARYDAGDYRGALDELLVADRIETRPQVLYALGQAARKLGECPRAISFFRAYLEVAPSASAGSAARAQINRCEAELAAQKAAQPPVVTAPIVVVEAPAPPPPPPPAPPARRDLAGGLLVGAGLAIAAGGAGLLGYADHLAADGEASLSAYDDAQHATTYRIAGGVLTGVGGALVVGGIIRYAVLVHRSHARAR